MAALDGERGTSVIKDHPFTPRGEWWSLCRVCNLSEAAHERTELWTCATCGREITLNGDGHALDCPAGKS